MIPACRSVSTIEIGIVSSPMPMKSIGRFQYIRHDAVIVCPHERRRARWSGAERTPIRLRGEPGDECSQRDQDADHERRPVRQPTQQIRTAHDRAAEEVGGVRPEYAPAGIA